MGRTDELLAELAVVELEERLLALKADPNADPEALRACKLALREARQAHRTIREQAPPEAAAGAAVARPATVQAAAAIKQPGGDR